MTIAYCGATAKMHKIEVCASEERDYYYCANVLCVESSVSGKRGTIVNNIVHTNITGQIVLLCKVC